MFSFLPLQDLARGPERKGTIVCSYENQDAHEAEKPGQNDCSAARQFSFCFVWLYRRHEETINGLIARRTLPNLAQHLIASEMLLLHTS